MPENLWKYLCFTREGIWFLMVLCLPWVSAEIKLTSLGLQWWASVPAVVSHSNGPCNICWLLCFMMMCLHSCLETTFDPSAFSQPIITLSWEHGEFSNALLPSSWWSGDAGGSLRHTLPRPSLQVFVTAKPYVGRCFSFKLRFLPKSSLGRDALTHS